MKVGLYGLVCALALGSTAAKADWLDSAANLSPFKHLPYLKEQFEHAYEGRHAGVGELSQLPGKDLADHYALREMRISTNEEWQTLLENYLLLPQAQKHTIHDYWEAFPHAYKVQDFLARGHYLRDPKSFVKLVRSFKHAVSSRPTGAAGANLLSALTPAERAHALTLLQQSEKPLNAIAQNNHYTVKDNGWKTYSKDGASYLWDLRVSFAQGKMGTPYALLHKLNVGPRIDEFHYNTMKAYDGNRDGAINFTEGHKAEARGNNNRNDGSIALMKFILADISQGNAERGVGMFLTRGLHTMVEMLRLTEHRYYVTPLALLLDALIEENNTNPDCKTYCTGNQVVARTVANWIIEVQHSRYVAQMLPLMRNRQGLIQELKKVPGVDFTSSNSPFTHLEEMAQEWGENLFGPDFQLNSSSAGNYVTLLGRYLDSSLKE